jgi:16S rRNA (cytosine1402-N4)-methyltransferase
MTADRTASPDDADRVHIPVMLAEVLAALQPTTGQSILDGTFGAGGYTRAILASGAQVIALDRDPNAIAGGQALVAAADGRLALHQARFSSLDSFAPETGLDGVVLDIGVSSMQIDEAARGFSFQQDGPLDMRMERAGPSAADVVNWRASSAFSARRSRPAASPGRSSAAGPRRHSRRPGSWRT